MKGWRRPRSREAREPFKLVLERRENPLIDDPDHLVLSGTWRAIAARRLEFPGLRYTVAWALASIATATIAVIGRSKWRLDHVAWQCSAYWRTSTA